MNFKSQLHRVKSALYIVSGLAITLATLSPLYSGNASAVGLVSSRSIQMSDSTLSATASYKVTFSTASNTTVQGIVVDFCDDSPIIGFATCTTPAGFSVTGSSISGQTSNAGCNISTFTSNNTLNSGRTFYVTAASGVGFTSAPCVISFVIGGVTNPSTANHSFYARIMTYDTSAHTSGYTLAGYVTGLQDAGGIALSTAATMNLTAKVQEQLSFCVYTTGGCGTDAGVTLGNGQGVLSSSVPSVDKNTFYDIQTNAGSNAIVNVKGATLTSGANTISALTSAAKWLTNTSQFGLCDYESSGANLSMAGNTYNGNNGGAPGSLCSGTTQGQNTGNDNSAYFYYGTNATSGLYGDTIATEAPGSQSTGNVVFLGGIPVTQTAGVYTTTLAFIATGTF